MADAKICDRCGKTELVSRINRIGLRKHRYSLVDLKYSWKTKYDCDLCAECGEKLTRFLKGAELEVVNYGNH